MTLKYDQDPETDNFPHRHDARVSGHIWADLVYADSVQYDDESMVGVSYTTLEDGSVTVVLEMEEDGNSIGFSGYLSPDQARKMARSLERAADCVEQTKQ